MIVGLTGLKQSGKSTVAEVFRTHGYFAAPFAGPLKQMLYSLLVIRGMPTENASRCLWGDLKEVPLRELEGRTARHAMQTLGTEWGRDLIGADLWVNAWRDSIKYRPLVVVDDVRFPNEVEIIRKLNGCVIRIERAGAENADPHPSEAHIAAMDVDGVLANNSSLERLVTVAHNTAIELLGHNDESREEKTQQ